MLFFSCRLFLNRETRIHPPAGDALLRPFRFDGLRAERYGATPTPSGGAAEPCEVLLLLDFAVESGGSSGDREAALPALLAGAARRIASDGVLLLALPNRFGLRFWSGCPEPGTGRLFSPLSGDSAAGGPLLVSRHELAEAFAQAGLTALEWFFPVWDAHHSGRLASLVSERLVAAAPAIASELATDRPFADPVRPRLDLFAEALVSRELARAGLFAELANFFLVAASAAPASPIWSRLRPPGLEIGWHYAADRKEATATVFELTERGLTVSKRRREGGAAQDFGDFLWQGWEQAPIAAGEAFGLRLQGHLVGGAIDVFHREFADFFAAIRTRYGRGEDFAGEALDAMLTNARRDTDGAFHLFDLEWRARSEIAASWWIMRNVLACLEMRGPAIPAIPTGKALYETLCQRLGVAVQFEADIARESGFAATVRASPPELHAPTFVGALARAWPVPALQGSDATAIRAVMEDAAVHQQLVANYRKLEAWALDLESRLLRHEATPAP